MGNWPPALEDNAYRPTQVIAIVFSSAALGLGRQFLRHDHRHHHHHHHHFICYEYK